MLKARTSKRLLHARVYVTLAILILIVSQLSIAGENKTSFKDVGTKHWASKEITFLTQKNIIKGFPDGSFQPNQSITRLQAVYMMLREKGITDFSHVTDPGFADMNPAKTGYSEVAKAVELGIISGKENKKGQKIFDPSGTLTRAQMAKILSLSYNLTGTAGMQFSDVAKDHWAYSYVQGLAKNKVTVGYGNGVFGANNFLTRAQFAVMMARTLDDSMKVTPPMHSGKVYPDGWTAPVLKSSWSPNHVKNLETLQNELGFTDGGHFFNIEGKSHAIVVNGDSGSNEVTFKYYLWTDIGLPKSYRIPVVSKELFTLYFEKDADRVWNYFNRNDIPERFTANGRKVQVEFIELDGSIYVQVGRKK